METSEFFQRVQRPGNPHAHPESVVVRGQVRFTMLTPRLLRLEWSPTEEFTDFATFAFPNRYANSPTPFTVRQEDERLLIEIGALRLSYQLGSGAFTSENLSIAFQVGGETRTWRPGQTNPGNLGGTRRTLDMTGGEVPLEPGLVSRDGWALFDDSAGVVLQPDDGWVSARPAQSEQDWYFFGYGHDYADAMAEYTQFGGSVPLIPRYVLGIWWSRFWPYSDNDLAQLVTDFADHDLPLDVLVVDMDWHLPPHWTGYTWNSELFPDPVAFLTEMHRRGLRVTLNLHPADGVHPHEAAYQELATALGMTTAEGAPVPFRIADRQFAEHYFTLLHHPLEDQGVDFWWLDWQQGEITDITGLDPLLWLNHLHFADARRRGQRPLLFSRWGGLGNHRYPIGFSGDTFGGWEILASLPHFTATAANVGFGWWSHDIGAHFGAAEPEIMTRWVQFGALSPCLRLHSVKHILADRRPWVYPAATLAAIRKAFELRYALVPYLYTAARQTHERGVALCRPMYYDYPEHESAYLARGQYQLGDDLLAAPITEPADPQTGLAAKDVWIPPGTWYRFDSGHAVVGPRWVRIEGDLETIPLFARAGSVIPLAKPALHLADLSDDRLDIRVFPGENGVFRLYEDDGQTESYLRGEYEWTTFTNTVEGLTRRVLRIAAVEGHYPGTSRHRAYRITFVSVEAPESITDGTGSPLSWSYDEGLRTLQVTLPALLKSEPFEVSVQWATQRLDESKTVAVASAAPLAHLVSYTASDEAARQLARLILVPPYGPDAQPQACDVGVLWRDMHGTRVTETRRPLTSLAAETILPAPFALDATLQPHHWEVEAHFTTGIQNATTTFSGPYINPPIQQWRVRYAGQQHWTLFQADTAARQTVEEPYEALLDPQAALAAEAKATLEFADSTSLWFDTWTNGSLSIAVDGMTVETSQTQPTLAGQARPWEVVRFGPVMLPAGQHVVEVRLAAPYVGDPLTGSGAVPWIFGVLLVDDAGMPVVRCMQVAEDMEPSDVLARRVDYSY